MYTVEITDFSGVRLGELLNIDERKFTWALNRVPTITGKIRSDNPLTSSIASGLVLAKVYYGSTLRFHGLVTGAQRVANREQQSLSFTFSGPLWRFTKRISGKSTTGTVFGSQDRGTTAKTLIDTANTENNTGVRTGTLGYTCGSSQSYVAGPYKPLSQCIQDLGATLDGFDWQVVPIEYTSGKIGDWNAAAVLGTTKANVVFEYGPGGSSNISEAEDVLDVQTMANKIYHISESGPGVIPVVYSDDTSYNTRNSTSHSSIPVYGLYEDIAQATLSNQTLRLKLVDEHYRLRKTPRRIVKFTPKPHPIAAPGSVPVFGVDYDLGDTISAIAYDNGGEWFDGLFRVYGYSATLDKEGKQSSELILVDEG